MSDSTYWKRVCEELFEGSETIQAPIEGRLGGIAISLAEVIGEEFDFNPCIPSLYIGLALGGTNPDLAGHLLELLAVNSPKRFGAIDTSTRALSKWWAEETEEAEDE